MTELRDMIVAYLCGVATIPAIILFAGIVGALERLFGNSQ